MNKSIGRLLRSKGYQKNLRQTDPPYVDASCESEKRANERVETIRMRVGPQHRVTQLEGDSTRGDASTTGPNKSSKMSAVSRPGPAGARRGSLPCLQYRVCDPYRYVLLSVRRELVACAVSSVWRGVLCRVSCHVRVDCRLCGLVCQSPLRGGKLRLSFVQGS